MKRELTEKELKGIWSFLVEVFEFTEEQNDAIHHQNLQMIQEENQILEDWKEIKKGLLQQMFV